ncbi:MAG: cytochrome d ubiquinol oxidase subunit II [Roseitalea sp.]|jgi:cytochrome d ubiquinol oxidase subunit II|nr:cytochrome d ubiquinol oxidase subunit II [Roseitalea sp.]MBO6720864.1 cytochrome d ubiquinol oxidase subunit II [Roseitalea sp.]MBO6743169.1 cytochrome d ubiquinol oxidase subunit II [Roseitalea sp.]
MDVTVLYPHLPVIFAGLMGIAILVYVVLDGFDLGVGILFAVAPVEDRDRMIASIGPFWDANETWLVLAIGILLVAFPVAHGVILTELYLPVAIMLIGLIARGVAFEFRAKATDEEKWLWNRVFFGGSLVTALSQGYMLGAYVLGLNGDRATMVFGLVVALCLTAAYAAIGAAWLIHKTDGDLQKRAVTWMRRALVLAMVGMVAISLATPFASDRIFAKWFSVPEIVALAPLPMMTAILFAFLFWQLAHLPDRNDRFSLLPFIAMTAIMVLGFFGLAYSFYPYVVPERTTIYEAAAAPESLMIVLVGAMVVIPVIAIYSIYAYRVFGGKATDLRYD